MIDMIIYGVNCCSRDMTCVKWNNERQNSTSDLVAHHTRRQKIIRTHASSSAPPAVNSNLSIPEGRKTWLTLTLRGLIENLSKIQPFYYR